MQQGDLWLTKICVGIFYLYGTKIRTGPMTQIASALLNRGYIKQRELSP